jgi:perosamine synthetase
MSTPIKIPLSRPDITDEDRELVLATLRTPQLSLGPRLREFEEKFAAYLGVKHAVAVNSGTSALHLCVRALGIGEGDAVITTPFSFIASANCLLFERARPVFVDIDPETLNIDVGRIEAKVKEMRRKGGKGVRKGRGKTGKLKAILPVHVFGRPCDMTAIMDIAKRYELDVIEDSCEALGAELLVEPGQEGRRKAGRRMPDGSLKGASAAGTAGVWRKAGSFGRCAAFGFYPNKQMTTGEGGMVVTNEDRISALCRSMRNQGRSDKAAWLQHERLGYNYRLSDINCALGISQLSRLPEMLAKRARVAGWYEESLKDVEGVIVPRQGERERISWFVYVIGLSQRFSRKDRDRILSGLRAKGIACSNYFTPIHLQPFYRKMFGFEAGDFPITENVAARTIALPFHNSLSRDRISVVADLLIREISKNIARPGKTRSALAPGPPDYAVGPK